MGSGQAKSPGPQKKPTPQQQRKQSKPAPPPAQRPGQAQVKKLSLANLKGVTKSDIERIQNECFICEAEIKNKYDIFMAYSSNSSKLNEKSFYELCMSLKNEIPEHLRKYSSLVFRSIDRDHDGSINFADFITAYHHIIRGDIKKKLEYAFCLYDSDGAGYLDVNKIKDVIDVMLKILQAEKHYNSQVVAENCFVLLDKKRNGEVGRDEFVNGLLQNYSLRLLMSPYS